MAKKEISIVITVPLHSFILKCLKDMGYDLNAIVEWCNKYINNFVDGEGAKANRFVNMMELAGLMRSYVSSWGSEEVKVAFTPLGLQVLDYLKSAEDYSSELH